MQRSVRQPTRKENEVLAGLHRAGQSRWKKRKGSTSGGTPGPPCFVPLCKPCASSGSFVSICSKQLRASFYNIMPLQAGGGISCPHGPWIMQCKIMHDYAQLRTMHFDEDTRGLQTRGILGLLTFCHLAAGGTPRSSSFSDDGRISSSCKASSAVETCAGAFWWTKLSMINTKMNCIGQESSRTLCTIMHVHNRPPPPRPAGHPGLGRHGASADSHRSLAGMSASLPQPKGAPTRSWRK